MDNTCYECQTYLAFEAEKEIDKVNKIRKFIEESNLLYIEEETAQYIPVIPDVMTKEYLLSQFKRVCAPYELPIGIDFSNTEPVTVSLLKNVMMGIVSKNGTEKINFVRYILDTLQEKKESDSVEVYISDSVDKALIEYKDKPCIMQYSYNPLDAIEMVDAIHEKLETRYQMLLEGKDEEVQKEPLQMLILNAKEAYTLISANKNAIDKYKKMVTQFKTLKVCVILADMDNTAISFTSCEVLKMIKDEKTLIIFENLNEQKVVDVTTSVLREYKKKLNEAEAYIRDGSNIIKVKIPSM